MSDDEKLTRFLAEAVLSDDLYWDDKRATFVLKRFMHQGEWKECECGCTFDPLHDLNDAFKLLPDLDSDNHSDSFDLGKDPGDALWSAELNGAWGWADTPQRAICLAVAKAHGYEVES